jgi:hypothetical protein
VGLSEVEFISHLDNGKIVCKGKKVKEGQE